MNTQVAAFTDTYFPSINGVTYSIKSWRDEWSERSGRMEVVYPQRDGYVPSSGEYPVRSIPFPFYDEFQLGLPEIPEELSKPDIVHLHGPFTLGISGLRLARRIDTPAVASYHTPINQYADYLTSIKTISKQIESMAEKYESVFYQYVDSVFVPNGTIRRLFAEQVGSDIQTHIVPTGINTDLFKPTPTGEFLRRYDINEENPIIGYTGRHGYEKSLGEIISAAKDLDVTVVFGGDGPARADLESQAAKCEANVQFLGVVDRKELPAFYSALDVFVFPSRVETQGLVALEALACGTPTVAVAAGALIETVNQGETGYHYQPGNIPALRDGITKCINNSDSLRSECLDRRSDIDITASVDQLSDAYTEVLP